MLSVDVVRLKGNSFLDKEDSFICAACGNISCSDKCHHDHYAEPDICQFKYNFLNKDEKHSLPSITSQNIHYARKYNLAQGTPLNKTSRNFISAYKSADEFKIYLQRGI